MAHVIVVRFPNVSLPAITFYHPPLEKTGNEVMSATTACIKSIPTVHFNYFLV